MNPEELRLGNYVMPLEQGSNVMNVPHQVTLITRTYVGVTFTTEINRAYSEIQGIPLTEEWFVKNCDLDMGWLNVWKAKIEYVHQLQNLYYALTGEELILNV